MRLVNLKKSATWAAVLVVVDAFFLNLGINSALVGLWMLLVSLPRAVFTKQVEQRNPRLARVAIFLGAALLVFGLNWANNQIAQHRAETLIAAIEAFVQKNDRFPEKLDELVPEFIDHVPSAKYTLAFSSFYYESRPDSHSLFYVAIPPFGRSTYNFEMSNWWHLVNPRSFSPKSIAQMDSTGGSSCDDRGNLKVAAKQIDAIVSRIEGSGPKTIECTGARRTHFLDFDGDGKKDIIASFTTVSASRRNSNYSIYISALRGQDGSFVEVGTLKVGGKGERNLNFDSVEFEKGAVVVKTAEYAAGDPMCCPSREGRVRFLVNTSGIRELAKAH